MIFLERLVNSNMKILTHYGSSKYRTLKNLRFFLFVPTWYDSVWSEQFIDTKMDTKRKESSNEQYSIFGQEIEVETIGRFDFLVSENLSIEQKLERVYNKGKLEIMDIVDEYLPILDLLHLHLENVIHKTAEDKKWRTVELTYDELCAMDQSLFIVLESLRLRIAPYRDHPFRRSVSTHSDQPYPVIPMNRIHLFRSSVTTDSGQPWPPCPSESIKYF